MEEMNEEMDLNTKLDRLIEAVTAVVQKVDEQQQRIDELDSTLYDGIIGPANETIAQNEYDNALSDFRTKYAEKLGGFEGAAKAIAGDDSFDVFKEAFDNYNNSDYDFSPDEYVDKLATSLTEQIAKIKEAVADQAGVAPEDVEVEVNAEDGEVQVDVDDKTTEEKPEDNTKEVTEEDISKDSSKDSVETSEGKTEETEESSTDSALDPEKSEESLADFEDSLRKEAEKEKDIHWTRG